MKTHQEQAASFYKGEVLAENRDCVRFVIQKGDAERDVIIATAKWIPLFGSLSALSKMLAMFPKGASWSCTRNPLGAEFPILLREYWTHFLRSISDGDERYGWTQRIMEKRPQWNAVYLLAEYMENGGKACIDVPFGHPDHVRPNVTSELFRLASDAVSDICSHYLGLYDDWKSKAVKSEPETKK